MLRAITHEVSPRISACELTFVERLPIDHQLAVRQHDQYCDVLSRLGVSVKKLSENLAFPDSCFVEDTAIVLDEIAVICSMGVASRRGEPALIERELSEYREIARLSFPATIEGGDVLRIGRRLFVGESSRTNLQGINELAMVIKPFGYEVVPVKTSGSLHIKSACTAIDDETLLINRDWVDPDIFKGFNRLFTPIEEPWSANILRIDETACVQAGFQRTIEIVSRVAPRVEAIDTSELGKAEGALTCLSIVFRDAA